MIKNYLKKDIYLKKETKKSWYQYNSIIMEYQKTLNLLDNTPNQPTKFRTKKLVETNDEERRTYNTNSQIKFKTSNLCDYSDVYILTIGTITVAALEAGQGNNGIQVVFKNRAQFTN